MATIIPLTTFIADGDFTFPREVEGSPLISTDEITKSKLITRTYAVYNSTYVPLTQGVPDVIYNNAYLVHEQPSSIQGPILFFQRVYAQLPAPRSEARTVSFSIPGQSAVQTSAVSGFVIGWNQYGTASPGTYPVKASVAISYTTSPFSPTPPITKITFNGSPVDFVGSVFQYQGNQTVVLSPTQSIVEPKWGLVGFTAPTIIPNNWILEVNISRWRGIIWQYEIVTVNTSTI